MLDNLSKYVYEVYKSKSVSAAAKKLYISQPALSSSVKKAEKELGSAIFNRKTIPFTLTPEGKIYIETIEKIIKLEQEMHEKIQDISTLHSGILNIATSTNLSYNVIPKICEQFRKEYPNVEINISVATTKELPTKLSNGTADLAFLPNENSAPGFTTIPLLEENLIVAVRRDCKSAEHLLTYALSYEDIICRNYPDEKKISDMSVFHGVEFTYSPPNSAIFKKRKMIFGSADSSTYINTTTVNPRLHYNLMNSGFGAFLTTDADISTMPPSDKCMYFALKTPDANQIFSIAYAPLENSHTRKLVTEFINTAKEFFSCDNPLKKIM